MNLRSSQISFLDLVFSLLGSTTILTIVMTITAGRSEHQLQKDFLLLSVRWVESRSPRQDIAATAPQSNPSQAPPQATQLLTATVAQTLLSSSPRRADGVTCTLVDPARQTRKWIYRLSTDGAEGQPSGPHESVFYFAPMSPGTWRVECQAGEAIVESMEYQTKRRSVSTRTSLSLLVEAI